MCDPVNYKPISLTCILCKIMEHIVASNVAKHMHKHNILYGLEHGFFFSSVYINGQGHMNKMATMAINSENL